MKICVITDDNAAFSKEEARKIDNLFILRMPIIIDGEVYFEHQNIDNETFFNKLENNNCSTSQPAPGEIMNIRNDLLTKYDAVIHIPMSSGLSEACNTAKNLSEDIDFKDKVFVVDNHRIEPTLKHSVYDALKLIKMGKTPKEIKEYLENEAYNASIYLMVDNLNHLKKGGRITPAAALLGGALHIKPILKIEGGKLDAFSKVLGVKKGREALKNAIKNDLETKFKDINKDELVLNGAYTYNKDEIISLVEEIKNELNIKNIEITPLSYVVTTHVGKNVLALTITKVIK